MNIVFRVDASLKIGTGHVMRCLTLADTLRDNGVHCHFISREHPGNLNSLVLQRGYSLSILPICDSVSIEKESDLFHAGWLGASQHADAQEVSVILRAIKPDAIVVDHYALDFRWETELREPNRKIIVIDDLADRHHECDLIIDQNLGQSRYEYTNKIPSYCKSLIGTKYCLLRPEFAEARSASLLRRKHNSLTNILISMGGVDVGNATSYVLDSIKEELLPNHKITIVLGTHSPYVADVTEISKSLPCPSELIVGTNSMANLMRESDLAIGAAGSTSWERCCMGLPTLMAILAENQKISAERLQAAGAAINFSLHPHSQPSLKEIFTSLKNDPEKLASMSKYSEHITDGLGRLRITKKLINLLGGTKQCLSEY